MRIISQDGMIDVPYEHIFIEIRENQIWCDYAATLGKMCVAKRFARYSTQEKAERAMEMLHSYYGEYMIEKIYKQEIHGMWPIFQFPQDDKI